MPKELTYEEALKREYHREYSRTHLTIRGRFEASFERFQAIEADESKDAYLSDGGKGAEAIRSFDETEAIRFRKAYNRAQMKVRRLAPECLETLYLIVKNGKDIQKTLCDMLCRRAQRVAKSKRRSSRVRSKKRRIITPRK